ncbi:putative endoglucanase precursor, partial [Basidiobolus meristosporus CBS 931.73]
LVLFQVQLGSAHMEMVEPAPRRSSHNPYFEKKGDVDYDIMSPLSEKRPFPCQGAPKGSSVASYSAGSSVKIKIAGGTPHKGGTCQFVISYDTKNWVVLKTVLLECLNSGRSFDIPLPANAPSGEAVLAWTWISKEGNRDFYMNCADVTINGKPGGSITGPKLAIAQLPNYPKIPE